MVIQLVTLLTSSQRHQVPTQIKGSSDHPGRENVIFADLAVGDFLTIWEDLGRGVMVRV